MCSRLEPAIENAPSVWADRIGVWTSAMCVVHCLLTPVLLSMSVALAHFLPSEERVHRSLALFLALVGTIALVRGFRRHRRVQVLVLMAFGLASIFFGAYAGDRLPGHWAEVAVTTLGSLMMIAAHRLNHTFCRDCSCSTR